MKCEVIGLMLPTSMPEIKLSHNGQELKFNASCFSRKPFQQDFDIFDHINQFWATFSEEEQQKVFDVYTQMSIIFSTTIDRTKLSIELNKLVIALLDLHDFERAYQWILYSPNCIIPDKFEREYTHSVDNRGTREQTYIRSDYTKLITLSMIFRVMIPVWGEFIAHTRQESGTLYKEFHAYQLLKKSKILHAEPFEKLQVFIDRTVGEDKTNFIIEGVGSEDFSAWMMGLVVIRRLCIGDIRGLDPKANIVTFIHRFVAQRTKGNDTPAENMVKEKSYVDSGTDMESKLSALERYKIKHDISLGEIVELEYSISDLRALAYRLTGNMSDELLNSCLETAQQLNKYRLLDPQVMLMRWVLKPAISPRGLLYLNKETLVKMLGLTQAVLWARGHHYLALLATSRANIVEGELFISGTDSRQRIPKEDQAMLDQLYPYFKIVGGKKTGQRPVDLAIKSIDILADDLSMFSWTMTANEDFIIKAFGSCISKRIAIPSDIKIRLAKLVIELGQRSWK